MTCIERCSINKRIIIIVIMNTDFTPRRLHVEKLERSSPLLLQWFLTSVFIETDINVQQGALFCDSLSDKGPLILGQVCSVSLAFFSLSLS